MQRLVLALIIVAILVAALAVAVTALRAALAGAADATEDAGPASWIRKTAFALLIALVGYVGIAGPD